MVIGKRCKKDANLSSERAKSHPEITRKAVGTELTLKWCAQVRLSPESVFIGDIL
jgi:hypothetical protein